MPFGGLEEVMGSLTFTSVFQSLKLDVSLISMWTFVLFILWGTNYFAGRVRKREMAGG